MNKQYIICAAIWFNDGFKYNEQPENITEGFVVTGRRHHNCFATTFILHGKIYVDSCINDGTWKLVEGFITSDDKFVTRHEAVEIAFNADQIDKKYKLLISEHLY